MNTLGQLESISYAYGATVVMQTRDNWFNDIPILGRMRQTVGSGMTLGSYINGGNSIRPDKNNPLFQHEYGHYLQGRAVGWGFLPMFGLPSIISAAGNGTHSYHFAEQDANARSRQWFEDNDGGINWDPDNFIIDRNLRVNYSNIFSYIF